MFNTVSSIAMLRSASMEKDDVVLLDSEPVKATHHSGVTKVRIPKRWTRRPDLKVFLSGELEICLERHNGRAELVIRRICKEDSI